MNYFVLVADAMLVAHASATCVREALRRIRQEECAGEQVKLVLRVALLGHGVLRPPTYERSVLRPIHVGEQRAAPSVLRPNNTFIVPPAQV